MNENINNVNTSAAYEIKENAQFNSIEIWFNDKPSATVRDALKSLKFRWHGVKKCWYGYADRDAVEKAINGETAATDAKPTPEKTNKFGVKVGDIFSASWGYDQTNNDFFQVIALVGETSVRVREVYLPITERRPVSGMSEDRTHSVVRELLPAANYSVFIKDQERGDLKRLKSYAADGVSYPQFAIASFANAHLCTGDTIDVYESWYA